MIYLIRRLSACAATLSLVVAILLSQASLAKAEELIRCAYPYWFGFAPVPVAMALGYYKEEGLKVTTVFDNDRANVLPALETGDLFGEAIKLPVTAVDSKLLLLHVIGKGNKEHALPLTEVMLDMLLEVWKTHRSAR